MTFSELEAKVSKFATAEFFKKCALSIEDGASVIEAVLGSGSYRNVLEIGTYRGITAAFMAGFVKHVTTIDLKQGKMEREAFTTDRVKMWNELGVPNISLKLVESNEEKEGVVSRLAFDLAFIDGDHTYAGVATDFAMVKHCGAVLFHDYSPGNDVYRFVRTLPSDQVQVMGIFAFWRG